MATWPAMEVGIDQFNHKPNSAFEALLHGYVVMCAGIRGRNTGMQSKEFFVGGTGKENKENQEKRSGRAPALIVILCTIRKRFFKVLRG